MYDLRLPGIIRTIAFSLPMPVASDRKRAVETKPIIISQRKSRSPIVGSNSQSQHMGGHAPCDLPHHKERLGHSIVKIIPHWAVLIDRAIWHPLKAVARKQYSSSLSTTLTRCVGKSAIVTYRNSDKTTPAIARNTNYPRLPSEVVRTSYHSRL